MRDCTATGYTLGSRLTVFAEAANAGRIPAEYGRRITAFLDTIEERKSQHDVYRKLAEMLDPDSKSPWATAEKIYQQLEDFSITVGYGRIKRRHKQPTTLEKVMVEAIPVSGKIQSAKSIYRALTSDICLSETE